jgi:hypothetical protein
MRDEVISQYQLGLPMVTPGLTTLREHYLYLSVPTCRRYIKWFYALGHARPQYATRNHVAERQVLGQHLVWLALYRIMHPEETIAEACAFLSNMDPTIAPFPPSKIVGLSTFLICEGRRCLPPVRELTGKQTYIEGACFGCGIILFGRVDINTSDMIDMDKCSLKIENSNPLFGKSVSWERCHFEGVYNQERKLNLMMAISADHNSDMEWHKLWPQEEGGPNLFRMDTFIESIINQLAIDWPGHTFCFTVDNLNIHHSPVLLHMIASWGHRYLSGRHTGLLTDPWSMYSIQFILFCCSTLVPSTTWIF